MKNFKEIAEKCLAGELSGTFKLASGESVSSDNLKRLTGNPNYMHQYQIYIDGTPLLYTIRGTLFDLVSDSFDIIDFIPNNMQKQIKIDIPEGKVPVMEQTESGVVITWKEKELTYADVISKLVLNQNAIYEFWSDKIHEGESSTFYKKVEVFRKLVNIRNYFGKPGLHDTGWFIMSVWPEYNRFGAIKSIEYSKCPETVIFKEKEHAEQAIKMLGDELKYLFEPW